jgi:hypothetical protein
MLTQDSLNQSLLPQPLKNEHPKAPNPKTPVAIQILFMLKIEMYVKKNKEKRINREVFLVS